MKYIVCLLFLCACSSRSDIEIPAIVHNVLDQKEGVEIQIVPFGKK